MLGLSSCPDCGTVLRIRDRTFVGRRVNCPECKLALRIEADQKSGGVVVRRLTADESKAVEKAKATANIRGDKIAVTEPVVRWSLKKWISQPLTAAWMLAIAVLAFVAVLTLTPKVRHSAAPARHNRADDGAALPVNPAQVGSDIQDSKPEQPSDVEAVEQVRNPLPDLPSVSALLPANLDRPLPWPALAMNDPKPQEDEPPPAVKVKIDVESKLAQRFLLYKQPKPVSRRDLLESLQEQLGAPILYDPSDLSSAGLDTNVTFELENTTLGDVIKYVADAANWEMTIEDEGLRLRTKP